MGGPVISVVVIVHAMRAQAMNTLHSLTPGYQKGAAADEYEVIVVENRSAELLDPGWVAALPGRFRYVLRDEPSTSPAAAINAGIALARGRAVGLMIDGARLVSPGVIRTALMAYRITPDAVVAVPGYQLGPLPQDMNPAHTPAVERALLASIGWPDPGYRLFDVASMSLANRSGILRPFMECNCLFVPRDILADIGGADERFDLPGGGALNLALYRRAVMHPRATLFVLPGEGSFHQVHGGVTTSAKPDREALLAQVRDQLNALLGEPFTSPDVAPILLGTVPPEAHPFVSFSAEQLASFVHRREKQRAMRAAERDGRTPEFVEPAPRPMPPYGENLRRRNRS